MPIAVLRHHASSGFALVETLVASVLISVGIMGFFALSNTHIKRAKNIQYHFVANAAATSLLASVRANPSFAHWLETQHSGNVNVQPSKPHTPSCYGKQLSITQPDSWCKPDSHALHTDLLQRVQQLLSYSFHFQENTAILCLRSATSSTTTPVRVIIVWQIPMRTKQTGNQQSRMGVDQSHCPASYSNAVPDKTQREMAYLELYSQI